MIEDILKHNQKSVVMIDEAYIDFGGESSLKFISQYENLLVIQTFSKSRSMAGMRIGFAVGNRDLIRAMKDVKYSINSYTMNQTAILAGTASVKNRDYFDSVTKKIINTREKTKKRLSELGFTFPDSKANFIFATNKSLDITDLFEYLRSRNIYVRHWDNPQIRDYIRITIGTEEEMERLFKEIQNYKEAAC